MHSNAAPSQPNNEFVFILLHRPRSLCKSTLNTERWGLHCSVGKKRQGWRASPHYELPSKQCACDEAREMLMSGCKWLWDSSNAPYFDHRQMSLFPFQVKQGDSVDKT
jgi:hypothetical protein